MVCLMLHGGDQLAFYILELVEAFSSNGILPSDINLSCMAFLDKKPEAQVNGHTPAMVFFLTSIGYQATFSEAS